MPLDKVRAVVLRTTDWSETSRIVTLFSREQGKLRGLARGGRRLKSSFDNGLDLLTLCDMVLLRKASGGLDLLTEALVVRRFAHLHRDLSALYAGYYVAELLADWTEEADPHPALFDEAIATLDELGQGPIGQRVLRWETVLLRELGYSLEVNQCVACQAELSQPPLAFSAEAGGVLCPRCQTGAGQRLRLSFEGLEGLRHLAGAAWREPLDGRVRSELRALMGGTITFLRGKPPKMLPYLGG
ncbi:MAG: DNA repair protein RecO [Gemmataceae bacterium]